VPVTAALAGALRMHELGIAVQPCHVEIRPSDGRKMLSDLVEDWQSHGANQNQILRAFGRGANAYLIACGPSRLVVADLDVKGSFDGIASWGDRPRGGVVVRTQSGGLHHYFRNDAEIGCPSSGLPGVDIKGIGGGVFGPGSLDGAYSIESWQPLTPWSSIGLVLPEKRKPAPPMPPDWRPAEIFCDYTPSGAAAAMVEALAEITEHIKTRGWDESGFRKLLLTKTWWFGGLVGSGYLGHDDAYAKLRAAITAAGYDPDDDDLEIIESGLDKGAQDPLWVRRSDPPPTSEAHRIGGLVNHTMPNLPDEFWDSRSVLSEIRDAAHQRARSADAVLGVILARLSSLLPGTLRVDTGVGMPVACNFYSILLGNSAAGKSTSADIAARLLPMMYDADSMAHPLGSGQGIAAAYGSVVEGEFRQSISKAFFFADEGASLLAQAKARESIVLATLREAWTGRTFGQKNATAGLNRRVSNYSLGLWIGLQSNHAAELFTDTYVNDGTIQRFMWFSATDPTIAADGSRRRALPQPLSWDLGAAWNAHTLVVPDWLSDELWEAQVAVARGEVVPAPGTEHNGLLRVKTAGLLAILAQRHDIDAEDWQLAGVVLDTSMAVAAAVKEAAMRRAAETERRSIDKHLRRRTAEDEHAEKRYEVKIEQLRVRAIDKAAKQPGLSYSDFIRALSKDREANASAVSRAVAADQLEIKSGTNNKGYRVYPKINNEDR
jgi:hypothetical protein